MKKLNKEAVSKMMSKVSKWGHEKSPRSKEHYSKIGKEGAAKRWKKLD